MATIHDDSQARIVDLWERLQKAEAAIIELLAACEFVLPVLQNATKYTTSNALQTAGAIEIVKDAIAKAISK